MITFPAKLLLDFIKEESGGPKGRLVAFSIVSGIASAMLLGVINHAADIAANAEVQFQYLLIYVIIFAIAIYSKKYALEKASIMVEEILAKVRIRIANKVRHTELRFVERTGHEEIYNTLARDTLQVSQSANIIFGSMQAAVMLAFTLVYIAFISIQGFLITIAAIVLGSWVFLIKRGSIMHDLKTAARRESDFFESLQHTLSGFKEVKLNRQRSQSIFTHQSEIAHHVEELKSRAGVNSVLVIIFEQIFFFMLIAVIIFIWPSISPETSTEIVIKMTASILFIIGPLELLVGSLPLFLKADVSINNIRQLEKTIDEHTRNGVYEAQSTAEPQDLGFNRIQLTNILFNYLDPEGHKAFSVGPINLEIERNEILFIVGGNGSGKSTLLKLLTGLYYPDDGHILVNNTRIDRTTYPDYRELFSTIFTDFHLFDRLYGIQQVDEAKVNAWIQKMGLTQKTQFKDGRFTQIDLSTGQRKRLAFIASVLEDKPIFVFDEWAADQDPVFRRHFYEVLLPDLRDQGKTIIAVTHDDRYFSTADRVLKMEEGQLVDYTEM